MVYNSISTIIILGFNVPAIDLCVIILHYLLVRSFAPKVQVNDSGRYLRVCTAVRLPEALSLLSTHNGSLRYVNNILKDVGRLILLSHFDTKV